MSVATELIPLETLFGNPERTSPLLSPDGLRLAFLAPVDGVLNVWVGDATGEEAKPVTGDRDRGVRSYLWHFHGHTILHLQDQGGDENWRLLATDLATGATRDLTPFDGVQVQIVEYNHLHPGSMIIGLNRDDERLHDAYLLELDSGQLELVARNPGNVIGWLADLDLTVRAAVAAREDGGFDLLVRDGSEDDWRTLLTWTADDNLNSQPLCFTRDGSHLMLLDARNAPAARLVEVSLSDGAVIVLAEDPRYDVASVLKHPETNAPQACGRLAARLEWTVLDPALADDFRILGEAHPGDFSVYDRTITDDQWLVGYSQDAGPVAFYRLNRKSSSTQLVCYDRSDLLEYRLAPMEPISYRARDGLLIEGYLTRPGEGAGPLVLNVHGGPWHRDTWGYDAEAQWLANRGYACLQVNFRGSTGYGKDFVNAGDREWGGKMHLDLVDAVSWAVTRGVALPDRIAIYGGSYGGYAALVGATFTPDLFCCAVDIVGPSNLLTFINSIPPYWSTYLEVLHRRVGNPETDEEFLRERSPLFRVDQIRVPLLIAQGANDPRVKQAESEQIVAALKSRDIPHEYLLFEDEGHGFAKPGNRLKFYQTAERFLARHLGGRAE